MKEIDIISPRQRGRENGSRTFQLQWARSHCSTRDVCAVIVNNLSESFNGARKKPIISMLETIRRKFMESWIGKYKHNITPRIWIRRVEKTKTYARNCFSILLGTICEKLKYMATNMLLTFSTRAACRMWDISAIPCKHGISRLQLNSFEFKFFVHPYYQRTVYMDVVPVGRPGKKERRSNDELRKDQIRARRVGSVMTCRKYFKTGHNARSCKNDIDPRSKYFTQVFLVHHKVQEMLLVLMLTMRFQYLRILAPQLQHHQEKGILDQELEDGKTHQELQGFQLQFLHQQEQEVLELALLSIMIGLWLKKMHLLMQGLAQMKMQWLKKIRVEMTVQLQVHVLDPIQVEEGLLIKELMEFNYGIGLFDVSNKPTSLSMFNVLLKLTVNKNLLCMCQFASMCNM